MNVGLPMKPAGAVEATVRPSAILTSSASPLITRPATAPRSMSLSSSEKTTCSGLRVSRAVSSPMLTDNATTTATAIQIILGRNHLRDTT